MTDSEFLQKIVQQLVEYPDNVFVERTVDEMGVLLSLTVDKLDMGKIIGMGGEMAKALRTIIRSFGMRNHARVNIKILEPYESNQE